MSRTQEERLIELYEKGVLTKAEVRALFLELDQQPEFLLEDEKAKLSFSLPNLKVFSSNKRKQEYSFDGIESLFLNILAGRLTVTQSKTDQVGLEIIYQENASEEKLPQLYVEKKGLYFSSSLPCKLTISLPQRWMSVFDLDLGQADARLDYLPFEDISIRSSKDKKQQDIRLNTCGGYAQHLYVQLDQAPLILQAGKGQGIQGKIESETGQIRVNRRKKISPYRFEKSGDDVLYIRAQTGQSAFYVKGIKDVD
ncbi:hypothetical protein ODU07_04350 [Streptococcus suis]|uniref:hypothetical protein n=1 Tax=Streptococcus suis TaxID=1307 RepID=UPI000CF3E8F5|nr:hypothetical protein [Streptococcus suis]MDW8741780.1 hypothetical protein [Streptococcus suis]NJW39021.1 hypothetical protein [Streptococcus suis]